MTEMRIFGNICAHIPSLRAKKYRKYIKRRLNPLFECPFLSDRPRILTRVKLPNGKLCIDLLNGAFLGFRKHSFSRFIYIYSLIGENKACLLQNRVFTPQKINCGSAGGNANALHHEDSIPSISCENVLEKYIKVIPLTHLLLLFQMYLKHAKDSRETAYKFLEEISKRSSLEMVKISESTTVADLICKNGKNVKHRGARISLQCNKLKFYDFIFQQKITLLDCRNHLFCRKLSLALPNNEPRDEHIINTSFTVFKTINGQLSEEFSKNDEKKDNVFDQPVMESLKPLSNADVKHFDYSATVLSKDAPGSSCFLSNDLICIIFGCIFGIKYWKNGFPFGCWINQYYLQNCHLYHPLLLRLYAINILPFYDAKKNMDIDFYVFFDVLKSDLTKYYEMALQFSESWLLFVYTLEKSDDFVPLGYRLSTHKFDFHWNDLIDLFSVVKRIASEPNSIPAVETIPILVKNLTNMTKSQILPERCLNTIAMICNRNDNVGGLESLLETVAFKMLESIESASPTDISSLLQVLHKNNIHIQELIDALACKLNNADLSEFSVACLALCVQTLGKIQATFKDSSFLNKIATHLSKNPNILMNASEVYCSSLLWGFYKMHFKNQEFLSTVCQRYFVKKRDWALPNVNSLVISLTSLTKLDFFDGPEVVIEIYKLVLKGTSSMSISTCQQLMTSVTRLLDNVSVNLYDSNAPKNIVGISNKLINACMNHVCERLLDQLTTTQAGAMLNALYRSRYRSAEIISPLIVCITGFNKSISMVTKREWISSTPYVAKKSLYAYDSLPSCPFNAEECRRRLEVVEPTHLVGICEAIHGLDFWSPYSLHLMLQIKKILESQLHDMKANHILSVGISFVDWNFTDHQLICPQTQANGLTIPAERAYASNSRQRHIKKTDWMVKVKNIINYNDRNLYTRRSTWFNEVQQPNVSGVGETEKFWEEFKKLLVRSQWKEELFLACIEGLQRHSTFLCASSAPLKRAKILYDLFRFNIYISQYPDRINIPTMGNTFLKTTSSNKCPFLILEHFGNHQPCDVVAVLPQNLIEFQSKLYNISRTESYFNFVFNEQSDSSQTADVANACDTVEDEEDVHQGDDFAKQANVLQQNDKRMVNIRPLFGRIDPLDSEETLSEVLNKASYFCHRGSGAIFELVASDKMWIYVDPVIGGFRTSILILNEKWHYIPHREEAIYSCI